MNIKKRLRTDRFVFASLLLLFIIGGGTRLNGSHQPVKIELDNRLQIIYQQDLASEMTVVKLFFRGGQSAEPASKRGLAFLTTRLCTELQTRGMIREMVELGSAIHVNSEGDFSSIQVKSLSENLDKTLEILVNNIRDPLLSSIRINNIKRFMKHVQKNESDTVQRLFIVTSLSHFFGNTGYGGSNMGTEVSLKGIKKKDIKQFFNRFIHRANMGIVVTSDLERKEIVAILKKHISRIAEGQALQTGTEIRLNTSEKPLIRIDKDSQQTLVGISVKLPPVNSKPYLYGYLLRVLMGNSIGSRIWHLRAEKKLAYDMNAIQIQMKQAGLFSVYLKTDIEKGEAAMKALEAVFDSLYTDGLSESAFEKLRTRSITDFLRRNETKVERTGQLGYFETMGLSYRFVLDFENRINQISLGDFLKFIKMWMKKSDRIRVMIGPDHS